MTELGRARLEIGQMQLNCPGETVCGDVVLVHPAPSHTLIAVADGLGHGPEANRAAQAFCDSLAAASGTVSELMRGAHRAISGTRGVVAMILRFDHTLGILETVGVGNIECHAIAHSPIRPVSSPGIVGHNMRRLTEASHRTEPGDWLAVVSDGVSFRASYESYTALDAQRAAEAIVRNHSRGNDDSSCVVVKVR